MPVFGSILAVVFLGETFYAYHAIGIAMIAGGIVLASVRSAPRVTAGAGAQQNLKTRPRANA
jgi:drug/metabolite transporter (DMT)-like permease